jgi:hypothetical protein
LRLAVVLRRAARERGRPLPSIALADALLDEHSVVGTSLCRQSGRATIIPMATLRELFGGEFGKLYKRSGQVTSPTPDVVFEVPQRLYCDFDACVCFLACYISAEFVQPELLYALVREHQNAVSGLKHNSGNSGGRLGVYPPYGPALKNLPYTGRIILYVDGKLDDVTKQDLVTYGINVGAWVQIRDRTYEEFITMTAKPLAFISHDSRDKDDFVRPLAEKLIVSLCPVWYDEFSMKPGDSLRESIDAGLRDSKKCVVVLSHNFFTNSSWGKGEFNAIVNKHFAAGGNVLIPIWHGVTKEEVADYSLLASDTLAIDSNLGLDEVARRLRSLILSA